MKTQEQSSPSTCFSASVLRDIQAAYRTLESSVSGHPCLAQGSVNAIAPKSPAGNVTYTWTRKVRAKTITVALSEEQAAAFRLAIAANRRVEEALGRLREVSQTALLSSLPSVIKRHARTSEIDGLPTVHKEA